VGGPLCPTAAGGRSVTLPDLPDHHRRLLADALIAGRPFGFALMGGYAVQAHSIVHRPSQDLAFATEHPAAMSQIIEHLTHGLNRRGWHVIDVAPLKARFLATDPATGSACEVDLLKEVLWRPPVLLERALGDRGLARDAIDVHAARHHYSTGELESLAERRPEEFDLQELHDRLESLDWISDAEFEAYGLDAAAISELRNWPQEWMDDLAQRLAEPYADADE
jgi:hypothetical protein